MPSVFDHVHSMLTAGLVVRLDLPSPDGATESAAVRSNDRAQGLRRGLRACGAPVTGLTPPSMYGTVCLWLWGGGVWVRPLVATSQQGGGVWVDPRTGIATIPYPPGVPNPASCRRAPQPAKRDEVNALGP